MSPEYVPSLYLDVRQPAAFADDSAFCLGHPAGPLLAVVRGVRDTAPIYGFRGIPYIR